MGEGLRHTIEQTLELGYIDYRAAKHAQPQPELLEIF